MRRFSVCFDFFFMFGNVYIEEWITKGYGRHTSPPIEANDLHATDDNYIHFSWRYLTWIDSRLPMNESLIQKTHVGSSTALYFISLYNWNFHFCVTRLRLSLHVIKNWVGSIFWTSGLNIQIQNTSKYQTFLATFIDIKMN